MADDTTKGEMIRAAAYVRMSTEHQQYSTSNQLDAIKQYAASRGIEIVQVYSDSGKSGLSIHGRDSLSQMINDVERGEALFARILVYDISRWGRFQDADESAYYEYICKRAGISVHYCAEQFENDGSPVSTIVKGVKRAMAGEYSRELSAKVFQGACRLIQLGFKQGGTAGYGLRRMLVDQSGAQKGVLEIGQQKSIQTDRVVLVLGPKDEIDIVKSIYEWFTVEKLAESQIASRLNKKGILTDFKRQWTRATVHEVLTNEKYIGNNVYHRTSFKLKKKHINNPADRWIRCEAAFASLIEPLVFQLARQIILERNERFTDDELLQKLRELLAAHGRISGILINEQENFPSSTSFQHRFGSLIKAYKLIGYTPAIDYSFIEINRRLREQHPKIIQTVLSSLKEMGASVVVDPDSQLMIVNNEIRVSLVLCRYSETLRGSARWLIRMDAGLKPDITIAVRMASCNERIQDYYLLPAIDLGFGDIRFQEANGVYLDAYRFPTLDFFFEITKRHHILDAA